MDYSEKSAVISSCGVYRYRLRREWRELGINEHWNWETDEPLSVLFIMLNPSTADADKDDPTIRRCVRFARDWGYERMDVVNLFAARSTNPVKLYNLKNPIGPDNELHVSAAIAQAGLVICAWGNLGAYTGQDQVMLAWLAKHRLSPAHEPYVLRLNANKMPAHPLYVPKQARPVRWFPVGWQDL